MPHIFFCCRVPVKLYLAYINVQDCFVAALLACCCVSLAEFTALDTLQGFTYNQDYRLKIVYFMFGMDLFLFIGASLSLACCGSSKFQACYQKVRFTAGIIFFFLLLFAYSYFLIGISQLYFLATSKYFSLDVLFNSSSGGLSTPQVDQVLEIGLLINQMLLLVIWVLFNGFSFIIQDMKNFEENDFSGPSSMIEDLYKMSNVTKNCECK